MTVAEGKVMNVLTDDARSLFELSVEAGLPFMEAQDAVLELEAKGIARKHEEDRLWVWRLA